MLEKTGKYVKGRYFLTGGSVGIFEGKKIGRAKNLVKLTSEILAAGKSGQRPESSHPEQTQ